MTDMLMTEEAVKEFLHIKDFRNIRKGDVIQMVSNLHRMNPVVAIKCIEQFPNFANNAGAMVHDLAKTCDNMIAKGSEEAKIVLESYSKSLEHLTDMLADPDISLEEKEIISEKIVYVGQQILVHRQLAVKERNDFFTKLGSFALGAMAILATAIGAAVTINGGGTPSIGYHDDDTNSDD